MNIVVKAALLCVMTLGSSMVVALEDSKQCIHTSRLNHTEIVDGQTILFHMVGKKTYVNKLPNKCPGLSFHKAFSYKTRINKLCSSDIIRVFQGDYFGAACGLGRFEAYEEESVEQAKVAAEATEVAEG